jgi:hypothetical protein
MRYLYLASLVIVVVNCDLVELAVTRGGENCLRRVGEVVGIKPQCINSPDQQTRHCPTEDSLVAKTVHVDIPVSMDFNNTSGDEVSLYWVSDDGSEIPQKPIPAWTSTRQDTFMGHVFRIRDKGGRVLLEHTVGLVAVRDGSSPAGESSTAANQRPHTDRKVEVAFVNRANSTLKLFFKGHFGSLELIAQMEPDTVYPQSTFKGHEFEIYTTDGKHVASETIGDVPVTNCGYPPIQVTILAAECSECEGKSGRKLKIRDGKQQAAPKLKIRRLSRHGEL